jgi:hypothetical protein
VNGFAVLPTVRSVPDDWAILSIPDVGITHEMVMTDPLCRMVAMDGTGTVVTEIPSEVALTFPPDAIAWTLNMYAVESETVNDVVVVVSPVFPRAIPFWSKTLNVIPFSDP